MNFANLAITTVAAAPSPAAEGLTLKLPAGVVLPPAPFRATVGPSAETASQATAEVLEVTEVTPVGGQQECKLVRAVEGPLGALDPTRKPRAIHEGDLFIATITAGELQQMAAGLVSPPAMTTATTYASPTGSDSNDGLSWYTPKQSIQAAHDALPNTGERLANGELNRVGTIRLAFAPGTEAAPAFEVQSSLDHEEEMFFIGKTNKYQEESKPGFWKKRKGSPYVRVNLPEQPKLSSAADIGKVLFNPQAPSKPMTGASTIIDFWEGHVNARGNKEALAGTGEQFYTLDKLVVKSNKGPINKFMMAVGRPALTLHNGVQLIGAGMGAGPRGRKERRAGTRIEDVGNGATIRISSGVPKSPTETRTRIADVALCGAVPRLFRGPNRTGGTELPAEWSAGTAYPKGTLVSFGSPAVRYYSLKSTVAEPNTGHNPETSPAWWKVAPQPGSWSKAIPVWGIYFDNNFGVMLERISVWGYTGWGIFCGNNGGVELKVVDCIVKECGNESGLVGEKTNAQMTGCMFAESGLNVMTIENCNFLNGYGCCAAIVGGHMIGNTFNHARSSFYEEKGKSKEVKNSGSNLITGTGKVPSNIVGGWMEGGECQINSGGNLTCIGVHMQGIPSEETGTGAGEGEEEELEIENWSKTETYEPGEIVEYENKVWVAIEPIEGVAPSGLSGWEEVVPAKYAVEGGGVFQNCNFSKYSKACFREVGNEAIVWINCRIGKPKKMVGIPFIERNSGMPDVQLFSADGIGRTGGREEETIEGKATIVGEGVFSSPPLNPGIAVGTEHAFTFNNSTGYDVILEVPVQWEAEGKFEREHTAGDQTKNNGEIGKPWSQKYQADERPAGTKAYVPIVVKAGEIVVMKTVRAKFVGNSVVRPA